MVPRSRWPGSRAPCCTSSVSGATWRVVLRAQRAARIARGRQRRGRAGDPGRDQLPGQAPKQALGPDAGAAVLAVRIRPRRCCTDCSAPMKIRVFAKPEDFTRFRDRLDEYQYQSKQVRVDYIDPDRRPTLANRTRSCRWERSCSITTAGPSGSPPKRAGLDQRPDQGHSRQAEQAVFRPGARRAFDR